jgi:hypothetical protein
LVVGVFASTFSNLVWKWGRKIDLCILFGFIYVYSLVFYQDCDYKIDFPSSTRNSNRRVWMAYKVIC